MTVGYVAWNHFRLFDLGNQPAEALRLVHGEIGKYFAVDIDILFSQAMYELTVGEAFGTHGGVDTGNPQTAVFALLEFAAHITVGEPFLQYIFGYGVYIFTLSVETLGRFEYAFPSGAGGNCIFGTWHMIIFLMIKVMRA